MSLDLSLSFSGCGALLTYHLGVATRLLRHSGPVATRVTRFAGSSGGAIAAVAIAMLSRERLLAFTEEYAVRGRAMEGILHALGVSARSLSDVGGGSQPADQPCSAAERLSGRVFIGATECTSGRPALFSRFASNEQLARCLVASCTIPPSARPTPTSPFRLMTAHPFDLLRSAPTYPEAAGVTLPPQCEWDGGEARRAAASSGAGGAAFVDGGLSQAAPWLPPPLSAGRAITISPLCGPRGVLSRRGGRGGGGGGGGGGSSDDGGGGVTHLHLCPIETSPRIPLAAPRLAGLRLFLSLDNLRAAGASIGASPDELRWWHDRGAEDARELEAWIEETCI
ncbi:hypothetical protein EMIHUDRAFT_468714 [Emiliania huxleyi CCMP1516]|uniref:PNPLA domain-containing protein n=2 Tax=Emiliania huxleyi TaxID=2903 RepID=A0A0D3JXH5_EMIH1|nr:hypothetical protein EMIHUDRAFT_468714 [Emiliania huxleyi CCMP1516]EOD28210.1 hypothetical protein EMIHUDRAFT_468714 [Emiliania huxleyi CCMP1516]|eukprot:XP_005780639.1 hypothetical protein EMIHUDRAFT_468714 [Emiliania huxleyi CCMP1516]